MIKNYDKVVMATKTSPEAVALYEQIKDLEGREYNRAVSGHFLDDMLDMLNEQQSLDFLPYMPTFLSALQAGMFDTAAKYLETLTLSEDLEKIKAEIIIALHEADNIKEADGSK